MGVGTVGLAIAIGKVVVVGGVSILCNTLITIHHNYKLEKKSSSSEGGKRHGRNKSTNERLQELRQLHEAE